MADPVELSPEVLARIRALAGKGGRGADDVLRLILGLPPAGPEALGDPSPDTPPPGPGFEDATYAVRFPEGFEIFRAYKGRPYRARVAGGRWRLDADGRAYDSLNQLSQAVIDGNENAWLFWHFNGPDGQPRRIAELRDPAQVQRRPRRRKRARLATPGATPYSAAPRAAPPDAAVTLAAASRPAVPAALAPPRTAQRPAPRSLAEPARPPAASEAPPAAGVGMAWQPRPKGG